MTNSFASHKTVVNLAVNRENRELDYFTYTKVQQIDLNIPDIFLSDFLILYRSDAFK